MLLTMTLLVSLFAASVATAQTPDPKVQPPARTYPDKAPDDPFKARLIPRNSRVYIAPMLSEDPGQSQSQGFETYLAAAIGKKKVQLAPVMEKEQADYVISGTSLDKKAGWAKIVFMGNVHSDNSASITMSDRKTGAIVYAYAVDKKSTMHGQQTTAEACAKHLKAHMEGKD